MQHYDNSGWNVLSMYVRLRPEVTKSKLLEGMWKINADEEGKPPNEKHPQNLEGISEDLRAATQKQRKMLGFPDWSPGGT